MEKENKNRLIIDFDWQNICCILTMIMMVLPYLLSVPVMNTK